MIDKILVLVAPGSTQMSDEVPKQISVTELYGFDANLYITILMLLYLNASIFWHTYLF